MALIICPECGGQVSDKSTQCIHCGYPLTDIDQSSNVLDNYRNLILKRLRTEKMSSVVVDISKKTGKSIGEVKEYVSRIKDEPSESKVKQAPRLECRTKSHLKIAQLHRNVF